MISKKPFIGILILSLVLFFFWATPSSSQVSVLKPVSQFIEKASQEVTQTWSTLGGPRIDNEKTVRSANNPLVPKRKNLKTDNWPLEGTGLSAKNLEPFLQNRQPEKIMYFRGDKYVEVLPKKNIVDAQGVMFISNSEAVNLVKAERAQDMASASSSLALSSGGSANKDSIGGQDYDLHRFLPGTRNDKITTIIPVENPSFAVYGPDFSLVNDDRSPEKLKVLRSRILSLGHSGEVVLKVKGTVDDGSGADFILYENVFEDQDNPGDFYQEFAHVGVATADAPEDFVWFPCAPEVGVLKGCMGAVPTHMGGDQFDLAQVGVKQIQYIKIKDTGFNFDNRDLDTAGADLDAGSLKHGTVRR